MFITTFCDQTQKARIQAMGSGNALGVHILLGPDGLTMLKNSIRNLQEGRIVLVQGVSVRVD
jgi:hypothetical protein